MGDRKTRERAEATEARSERSLEREGGVKAEVCMGDTMYLLYNTMYPLRIRLQSRYVEIQYILYPLYLDQIQWIRSVSALGPDTVDTYRPCRIPAFTVVFNKNIGSRNMDIDKLKVPELEAECQKLGICVRYA